MSRKYGLKYIKLLLFGGSLLMVSNCSKDSASDTFNVQEDQAADYYAKEPVPIFRTPVVNPALVAEQFTEYNCNDGYDNNGNGLVDCMDPACSIHPECSEWGAPLEEVINSRGTTVYPNGLLTVEDIAIRNARPFDDDDNHDWLANGFFALRQKDCWVAPVYQDPYYNIPLGEPLVVGPFGPIGPQLDPAAAAFRVFGPRAGLINECEDAADIMWHHVDDDNGPGAGAGGDTYINENDDDWDDNRDRNGPRGS